MSRSPDDSTPKTDPDTTPDPGTTPDQPIHGEDSDGPTPDDDATDTDTDTDTDGTDTDAPPVKGEAEDGPAVDEEGVPLNFLGNRQGEHPFADMGEYIPMGGDRSNGMGSYDQRVAPLIADHNPWGEHGSRDEFNAHHRPDGTYRTNRWPDNDGAVPGSERQVTLPRGTVLDRFGAEGGRFLSPLDSNGQPYHYGDRAIFPDNAEVGYHIYVVDDPNGLQGELADVAPALGQDGGGRQFTLPEDVKLQQLLAEGVLREVHVPPADGRVLPDSFGQDRGDGTQNTDTVSVDDASNGVDPDNNTDTDNNTDNNTDNGTDNGTDPRPDTDPGDGAPDTDATPPLPENLQQVADNSSFRTPAGGALFDPSDVRTRDAANAVAPIDGHFILDVHSDGQHAIVNGQQLNGADLADLARNLGWNGTDPIILNGCEAGRSPDGLAADLARASNAQVIAPTERSWSGEQNTTPYSASVDSVDDRGRARPTIPPDGGWRSFDPDGNMRDAGSNGLPVDTRPPSGPDTDGTTDTSGTPNDDSTPGPDNRQPVPHGGDVDRGRIQSPFNPPMVTDPGAPHTIRVDDNAAAAANQTDPHRPLRDGERLIGRDGLTPNSEYRVPGRGTYYTDDTGTITHADLEVSNTQDGITAAGADRNPDASYPEPNTTYRIDVDGSEHTYTTDDAGLPPRYTEWNQPQPTNGTVTFPSTDPTLSPNDDGVRPPTVADPLNARTSWPPNSEIVYVAPNGTTTRLYTGDVDPATGQARVEMIDTESSPGNGARNRVLVDDLNPELNNFPPNTVTRINGTDVYVTNEHGVTFHATDERTYGHSAPRSGEAQGYVGDLGTNTDGGHIRPTGADGAPDARNQFPQDSDENRPKKGQTTEGTWYGQDREARFEQQKRGTDHLWHDLETEGSHAANPGQPTVVHERWVMRDSNGDVRLHFRRYDN
ncbi:MAG: TNT domain-containing protein [Actinophytocola sp.]|uniref:TNT domain-containing protein n=1 Tax=Actinophytocola sp. TaxID=1872138 RepID=UPI003C70D04C